MTAESEPQAFDYEALARFREALRRFLRSAEEAARDVGLSPEQHQLLLAVKGHPGDPPSVSQVADALQRRPHSTLELVRRAEAEGWLVRRPSARDKRRHLLAVTPAGEAVLARLYGQHDAERRQFRAGILEALRHLDR